MKIASISIKEFRAFQEEFTLQLGDYITCISGQNGIGKSTILAVLSNCCELKSSVATHLNGSAFRGDFKDMIIGDEDYDTSGEKVTIKFKDLPLSTENDIYVENLVFRTTFQKNEQKNKDKKRFRLIPKKQEERQTEQKIKHPSYYLGLSRLFPVGESKQAGTYKKQISVSHKLISVHEKIMNQEYGENAQATPLSISEYPKKKLGIKNDKFSSIANSSGQDNLSQIILTILSFEELKNILGKDYHGGLVLIDEIDATLHPAAQMKLFDYLFQQAKELDLQIVFTTHSLSLLEHITDYKNKPRKNEIKIAYLIKMGQKIHEVKDRGKEYYRLELTNSYLNLDKVQSFKPVFIFTEDEVARWFLKKILALCSSNEAVYNIKLLDVNMSWSHIINLITSHYETYQNYIAILDPDVCRRENKETLQEKIKNFPLKADEQCGDILTLPSKNNETIEELMWDYFYNLPEDHDFFFHPTSMSQNWQKCLLLQHGINSKKYKDCKDDSHKKKCWFKDSLHYINLLFDFWARDNEEIVDNFIKLFKSSYHIKNKRLNNLISGENKCQ
ncbi:AAA family ATPase [Orbus wheelerorum]|uniref:ATP-dependent nuclease n=1 Tax=Orbus wheelerorum TaxID=3074111 RepID=UPI00370D52E1